MKLETQLNYPNSLSYPTSNVRPLIYKRTTKIPTCLLCAHNDYLLPDKTEANNYLEFIKTQQRCFCTDLLSDWLDWVI